MESNVIFALSANPFSDFSDWENNWVVLKIQKKIKMKSLFMITGILIIIKGTGFQQVDRT
jgi:hypothetical protein